MSNDVDKKLEEYIKNCINSLKDSENKFKNSTNKQLEIKDEELKDFDDILKFVVNTKTNQVGLLLDPNMLESYNKTFVEVLIENITASANLLKESLKK